MAVCIDWLQISVCIFGIFCSICQADYRLTRSIKLNENLQLGWRINSTMGMIQFSIRAKISENGWFMIGFAPQKNFSEKVSFKDISGDGFLVWKGESKDNSRHVWRINEVNVNKGTLQKEEHQDVHLGSSTYNKKTKTLKAIVWRALKTGNDMELKKGEIVVFASYGNDDGSKIRKWKNKKKELIYANAIEDAFIAFQHVNLFTTTTKMKTKSSDKKGLSYAEAIAEKHWIGVILGISAFLTVLITCSVYCFSKKKKNEFKRVVSMPFHKNSDFDDEAKVAFLQSEET